MSQNQQAEEKILLYSRDPNTPTQASLTNVTQQLSQYNKWKMQRKIFKVYDDKYLSVVDLSLMTSKKYWFQLCHLDPEPENIRSMDYRFIIATLVLGIIAYLTLYAGASFKLGFINQYYKPLAALLITSSVISLVFAIYISKNVTIFYSYNARFPMAVLLKNYPSKAEYRSFLAALSALVRQARDTSIHEKSQDLANELSELRRLKNDGFVTQKEYDEAKRNIFSHHGSLPVSEPQSSRLENMTD